MSSATDEHKAKIERDHDEPERQDAEQENRAALGRAAEEEADAREAQAWEAEVEDLSGELDDTAAAPPALPHRIACPNCGSEKLQEVGCVGYWMRGKLTAAPGGPEWELDDTGLKHDDDYRETHIECADCLTVICDTDHDPHDLPRALARQVEKALAGESNDAEHDALYALAEHFNLTLSERGVEDGGTETSTQDRAGPAAPRAHAPAARAGRRRAAPARSSTSSRSTKGVLTMGHSIQSIPCVERYAREHEGDPVPVVAEHFTTKGGWLRHPWKKRISRSYARRLKGEGVTCVGLLMAPGRIADFKIELLLRSSSSGVLE
ncbi:MAG TPA: hypothetical protein VFW38_07740 [Solirubrobacteraceae bacterium]|nr:hypothetical protein [Solirubrobacteraceae bacterium]